MISILEDTYPAAGWPVGSSRELVVTGMDEIKRQCAIKPPPEPQPQPEEKQFVDEAEKEAYTVGLAALAPMFRRLIALEKELAELKQSQVPPHLRGVEKRAKA